MAETIIDEIMKQYQKQYKAMMEIERLTGELGAAIQTNDKVTIQLVLDMRQQVIYEMEACRRAVVVLTDSLPQDQRIHIKGLLKKEEDERPENVPEERLKDLSRKVRQAAGRVIEMDRRISLKTAGKDSFYYREENR